MQPSLADEPAHLTAIREQLRRFVATEAPANRRIAWDRAQSWPRDVYAKLNALGLTAA